MGLGNDYIGPEGSFWGDGNVLKLDGGKGCTLLYIY